MKTASAIEYKEHSLRTNGGKRDGNEVAPSLTVRNALILQTPINILFFL